jgi:hypothetical protein
MVVTGANLVLPTGYIARSAVLSVGAPCWSASACQCIPGDAYHRLGHGQDVAPRCGIVLAERDAGQRAHGLAQRPGPLRYVLGVGKVLVERADHQRLSCRADVGWPRTASISARTWWP